MVRYHPAWTPAHPFGWVAGPSAVALSKRDHTEEQILRALHQAEGGTKIGDICREHGIGEARGSSGSFETGTAVRISNSVCSATQSQVWGILRDEREILALGAIRRLPHRQVEAGLPVRPNTRSGAAGETLIDSAA